MGKTQLGEKLTTTTKKEYVLLHSKLILPAWGPNYMIIVTPSFSESSVFKMFSIHTQTKRAFSWHASVDRGPNFKNKVTSSNFFSFNFNFTLLCSHIKNYNINIKK